MAGRIGILTGGGDCPGLNAVIRAVTRRSLDRGSEMVGVREGWRGMADRLFQPLDYRAISGLLPRGGTILGTSRTNPFKSEGGVQKVLETLKAESFDALVAIGGEDTLGVAARLYAEHEFPVVGVPKTIDNDLSGTDYTFGFDTAVSIATEAIDRLHTTAESHNRVMVVEVMGRHTGWIAVMSGIAGGADAILIPEQPITVEAACGELRRRHERGKDFSIVVVSEGYELTYESGEQRDGHPGARRRTSSAMSGWAASARRSRARSRSGPATRPASPSSATSSAGAPPRRATASSRRATGSRRPISSRRAASAGWPRSTATRSSTSPSRRRRVS